MIAQEAHGAGRVGLNAAQDLGVHGGPLLLECVIGPFMHEGHVHVKGELAGEGIEQLIAGKADDLRVEPEMWVFGFWATSHPELAKS